MKELTEYSRGFMESAIDGEGNISLIKSNRPQYKPVVVVSNTNNEWLQAIKFMTGIGEVYYDKYPTKEGRKAIWRWKVTKENDLRDLLSRIHLIIKEKQRLLLIRAISLLQSPTSKRYILSDEERYLVDSIYLEMRELNKHERFT